MQSVRRVAFGDRWDAEFALSIIGVPWLPNPKGSDPKELEGPVAIRPECPDVPLEAPDVAEKLSVHVVSTLRVRTWRSMGTHRFAQLAVRRLAVRAKLVRSTQTHAVTGWRRLLEFLILTVPRGPN